MECQATKYFPLEIDLDLDFCIHEAKIYTTDTLPHQKKIFRKSDPERKVFLVIEAWTNLDETESAKNVLLYTRPTVLIILSIISYLSDHPLTIYEVAFSSSGIASEEKPNKIKVSKLIHDQVDKSDFLLKILEHVYLKERNFNEFLASIFSRWHKARYLEEESDASLYSEESFLVYFHVIEFFANHYGEQQSKEAQDQIKQFTKDILSNTLKLRDNHLEQITQEKYKSVRSILLSDGQIPVASKICYFLDRLGLLDLKTQYFVEQLVKIRNTIAHGRHVKYKNLNWPLPPFLLINDDVEEFIFEIRVFTGRVISAYLDTEAWSDKWTEVHQWLHPPPEYVKKFIRNNSFDSISSKEFIEGVIDGVRPSSLVANFLSKKIKLQELEKGLKSLILGLEIDQHNAIEVFTASILLADSTDKQISDRCRDILINIHRNELVCYSNIKDVLRELEQEGVKLIWFRQWIETGGHRDIE